MATKHFLQLIYTSSNIDSSHDYTSFQHVLAFTTQSTLQMNNSNDDVLKDLQNQILMKTRKLMTYHPFLLHLIWIWVTYRWCRQYQLDTRIRNKRTLKSKNSQREWVPFFRWKGENWVWFLPQILMQVDDWEHYI